MPIDYEKLRKNQTPHGDKLWYFLRDKRFDGFKFVRQYPIGRYITDFCCRQKKLIIELDGGQHNDTPHDEYSIAQQLGAIINLDDISHIGYLEKHVGLPELLSFRYNPGSLVHGNVIIGDSTTLIVDATNHRVGIGTATPTQRLTVAGGGQVDFFGGRFNVNDTTGVTTISDLSSWGSVTLFKTSTLSLEEKISVL